MIRRQGVAFHYTKSALLRLYRATLLSRQPKYDMPAADGQRSAVPSLVLIRPFLAFLCPLSRLIFISFHYMLHAMRFRNGHDFYYRDAK